MYESTQTVVGRGEKVKDEPGYYECAQYGCKCKSYAGAEANRLNRSKMKTSDKFVKWVPGRYLTEDEMIANEKYWLEMK
jgi:hypothetical protein